MIPLPSEGLLAFEAWLWDRWDDRAWFKARGSLAVSFGLLGLRWCEVERLRPGDLQIGGRVFVRTAKRGRKRTIDAPERLVELALRMRAKVPDGEDRVFITRGGRGMVYQDVRRFVRSSTERTFGRAFTFHCFRHTAAVRVYERTRDVVAVQRLLGHTSLQWTNTYLSTLMVVDTGGPVAFAGGGKAGKPRLYDPDGPGGSSIVRSVASRKSHGKAAGGADQEAFNWDEERVERKRVVEEKDRRVAKADVGPGSFGEGGKWEGLSTAEAFEKYHDEVEAMTEGERATEEALQDQEAEGRKKAERLEGCYERSEQWAADAVRLRAKAEVRPKDCSHGELREKRKKNGRHELWCKVCGEFYCYSFELSKREAEGHEREDSP